jgi:hypothetical protein
MAKGAKAKAVSLYLRNPDKAQPDRRDRQRHKRHRRFIPEPAIAL